MEERKTVLVIDDSAAYRVTLSKILKKSYNVLTACNGEEAIKVLCDNGTGVSLMFLDLVMPDMDGRQFLKWVSENGQYIDIPIIVTTSNTGFETEVECLELGASEFVTKPFMPEIVIKRAESLIRLHETSVFLNNMKTDPVTGALNKTFFFDQMKKMFDKDPEGDYDVLCVDVEGYRLLLDRYGEKGCEDMLRKIYEVILSKSSRNHLIGKISESQFILAGPAETYKVYCDETIEGLKNTEKSTIQGATVNCGVYQHVDKTLSPEAICSNAVMAAESISGKYGVYCAKYDESLREKSLKAQFITEHMEEALNEHQFIVYYQPKFSITDSKVNGAEALVRWIHPTEGFMNPGEFISIFEHNGFIQELDRYMLKTVCGDIKDWIMAGNAAVPVSVNVSQANFDRVQLADEFEAIVDSYGIDHSLIHFEITESVNSADANKKNRTVSRFRERGFLVELDDFGSGYSSLTTLCTMPVDVVKLDMGLIKMMFEKKHAAVLSGALFTAKELSLKVVAEGVETIEQLDELKRKGAQIDDMSVQGYYFSKPLPKDEFEAYLLNADN